MKTSELLKLLDEQAWTYVLKDDFISITNVADVGMGTYRLIIYSQELGDRKVELLKKLIEYRNTPIEEREEPKRYYIRPKGMKLIEDEVLNYYSYEKRWFIDSKKDTNVDRTQFTLKELEDLGINPEHYDLEEVK